MPFAHDVPVALHAAPPAHVQPGRVHTQVVKGAKKTTKSGKKHPARAVKEVTVRAGDSIYAIARTHHSSVAAIVKANPGIEFRRLVPGTALKVPAPTNQPPAQKQAAKPRKAEAKKAGVGKSPTRTMKLVTAHPGDSVQAIAKREHASLAAVLKSNPGIDTRRLRAGSRVRVPIAAVASAPESPKPSTNAPRPKHVVTYAGTAAARGYPASVVASGDRHRRQLATANLPNQARVRSMIAATAKRYGVDPRLALAIGWQESNHRQSAVSVCDALGVMQVMPPTGQWAGGLVGKDLDLLEAQDNITAGIATLRFLTQHAADQDEAIGSYYQGLAAVRAHGFYPDTREYVNSVKNHMKRF